MTRHDAARVLHLVKDPQATTNTHAMTQRAYRRTTSAAALLVSLGAILGSVAGFVLGLGVGVLLTEQVMERIERAIAASFTREGEYDLEH